MREGGRTAEERYVMVSYDFVFYQHPVKRVEVIKA